LKEPIIKGEDMTAITNFPKNAVARLALICSGRGSRLTTVSTFALRYAGAYAILICVLLANVSSARAQGSRKDDIAFGASGRPIAGATITVCLNSATSTPCSPLATLYTDATLSTPSPNPFQADGLGDYHFYAAPGRYVVQVSGSGINTYTMNDMILPNDPSTPTFNSVTATSINLGGNLSVGGDASINGTLSAGTFAPSTISTRSLQVAGSSSFQGPRPWIDVTAHGADPAGAADSTAAIQAAINAACASPGGTVYLPAGSYKVLQPQTPSTAPVFRYPSGCVGLTLQGGSSGQAISLQFARPPMTSIGVFIGSNPNMAPVFLLNGSGSGEAVTFRDLEINGYNQAVQTYNLSNITFDHVCLSNQYTGQGLRTGSTETTDNAALAVYNTFWIWFRDGCLVPGATTTHATVPAAVFAFVGKGLQGNLGLFEFRDVVVSGGGFVMDCRDSAECPNGGGNIFFDDVFMENAVMPFYTVNNSAKGNVGGTPVFFNNVAQGDCPAGGLPFMSYNTGARPITGGVYFNNVAECSSGVPAVSVSSGSTLNEVTSINPEGTGAFWGTNSNGSINGTGMARLVTGTLFWGGNGAGCGSGEQSSLESGINQNSSCGLGEPVELPTVALAAPGSSFANFGCSATFGCLFGSGSNYSYESGTARNSTNTLDIELSAALPPTGITLTQTTGGTLVRGTTYFYSVQTLSAGSGNPHSAASNEVATTISSSNDAVTISWMAPAGFNPGSCNIYRATTSGGTINNRSSILVAKISNCTSTTRYTDTGGSSTASYNATSNKTIAPYFHFAPISGQTSVVNVPGYTGSPSGCATWSTPGLLTGTGADCGATAPQTAFVPSPNNAGNQVGPSGANAVNVVAFWIPFAVTFSHLTVDIGGADKSGANLYDVGVYNLSGAVQCSWGATSFGSTGMTDNACKQGSVTLSPGYYVFAFTGNATAAKIYFGSGAGMQLLATAISSTSSSGGALPNTIAVPGFGGGTPNLESTYSNVYIALTQK
jgi:hypothetical protein